MRAVRVVVAAVALLAWTVFDWFYAQRLINGPDDPLGAVIFWLVGCAVIVVVWGLSEDWGEDH
jgi:hypothetical protein